MTIKIGPLLIDQVSSSSEDWNVIKDEKYRPNREKFILDAFNKDFPSINIKSGEKVYGLCSRSSILSEWLAKMNLLYSQVEAAPTYYRDNVTTVEYEQASKQIDLLNNLNKEKANELLIANQKYKEQTDNIERIYADKAKKLELKGINYILSLKTTDLPLTILLGIENFTPVGIAGSPSSKTYAREMLVNYKVSLLKYAKANPTHDIVEIIEKNKVK